MSKEVTLTNGERLGLANVINTVQFPTMDKMGDAIADAQQIRHTPEEIKEINLRAGETAGTIIWDENAAEKSFTLSDTVVDAFREYIKKREEAKDLTIADSNLISLHNKLK